VNGGQLACELAVKALLEAWLPTYVARQARRYNTAGAYTPTGASLDADLATYALPFRPRGISVVSSFEDWPVDALPHVQIMSPGWERRGGDQAGDTIAYQVNIACIVGAAQRDDTRFLRACYEDAILELMRHKQTVGGFAAGVNVLGGGAAQWDPGDEQDARTFQGSAAAFEVLVQAAVDPRGGPALPDPLPDDGDDVPVEWPDNPTVDQVRLEYPEGNVTVVADGEDAG
jgi:hypothetical protein